MNKKSEKVLSVVIPVYNEEKTVVELIKKVESVSEVGEIIIVEDCSKDNTFRVLEKYSKDKNYIKLFKHEVNKGKGAAIRNGFDKATMPYLIIQDADLEYNPEDYPKVLEPLLAGKADVVYGSRFMHVPGQVRFFRHEMGNKFLTFLSNLLSDIHLTDMETCYKAFKREVVQNLILTSERFGIEPEITAKLAKARILRIYDVPISYNPRKYDEGKKITWKDGIAAFKHILKFNLFTSPEKSFKKDWKEVLEKK